MTRRTKGRQGRPAHRKRRGRLFVAFERSVLGFGMGVVAFFIERRLIKAIKKGGITAAPRTAAESGDEFGVPLSDVREGELTTSPHQVGDQAER
jgi:hypothetical protein